MSIRSRINDLRSWARSPRAYKLAMDTTYILTGGRAAQELCAALDEGIDAKKIRGYTKLGLSVAVVTFQRPIAAIPLARSGLRDLGLIDPPPEP